MNLSQWQRGLRRTGGLILAGIYAGLGLFSVEPDESAVAYRFGRATARDILPGIHWNPPWPVGRVSVAKTATNFVMPIGYRLQDRPDKSFVSDLWLTQDTNIVQVRFDIQYRIRSLADFELAHEAPLELIRRAGERVLSRSLLTEGVDAVLTTRKQHLRESVHQGVQSILDAAHAGIEIQSVNVQELAPPRQGKVRAAFQEVQNARADRERVMHEARAYRAQVVAEAEGAAQRLRSDAQAQAHRRTELARGHAERFTALAQEFERAPRITEHRLYLESLERLLPSLETYVVEPGRDGSVNLRVVQ